MSTYIIEIQSEVESVGLDLHELERLAARALDAEQVAKPAELSVVLVDDPTIHELNRTYRQTDSATDVLSFAQGEGADFATADAAVAHLGDVVISVETARRQAQEYAQSLHDEVAHLLVHGILHLLGYDHDTPEDASAMRLQEDAVLGAAHHH